MLKCYYNKTHILENVFEMAYAGMAGKLFQALHNGHLAQYKSTIIMYNSHKKVCKGSLVNEKAKHERVQLVYIQCFAYKLLKNLVVVVNLDTF